MNSPMELSPQLCSSSLRLRYDLGTASESETSVTVMTSNEQGSSGDDSDTGTCIGDHTRRHTSSTEADHSDADTLAGEDETKDRNPVVKSPLISTVCPRNTGSVKPDSSPEEADKRAFEKRLSRLAPDGTEAIVQELDAIALQSSMKTVLHLLHASSGVDPLSYRVMLTHHLTLVSVCRVTKTYSVYWVPSSPSLEAILGILGRLQGLRDFRLPERMPGHEIVIVMDMESRIFVVHQVSLERPVAPKPRPPNASARTPQYVRPPKQPYKQAAAPLQPRHTPSLHVDTTPKMVDSPTRTATSPARMSAEPRSKPAFPKINTVRTAPATPMEPPSSATSSRGFGCQRGPVELRTAPPTPISTAPSRTKRHKKPRAPRRIQGTSSGKTDVCVLGQ